MKFIVAMTGASGQIYALRLLHKLSEANHEIALVLSEPACLTLGLECDIKLNANRVDVCKLMGREMPNIQLENPRDVGAGIASGSHRHDGMIIVPCSMGTLGRVAHGTSEDLIGRASDVCLKERRPLILVTREMPLSLIHLRNMVTVTEAGAIVMHACPHFYHRPQSVEAVADTVVERILDQLDVDSDARRWKS